MEIKKIFQSNYLSTKKFQYGETFSISYITLCLILSLLYWNEGSFSQYLTASYYKSIELGELWRLVSTTFVHADLKHLLSNSLMLFILFYFNAAFYGGLFTFLHSVVMGSIINLLTLANYPPAITLVGASGVVFYLWGFWLVLYVFLQTQYSIINRLLRVGAIFLILLVPTSLDPQTSYSAHYIGFLVGVVSGFIYYFYNRRDLKKYEAWKFEYIPEDLEQEVEEFNYFQ